MWTLCNNYFTKAQIYYCQPNIVTDHLVGSSDLSCYWEIFVKLDLRQNTKNDILNSNFEISSQP